MPFAITTYIVIYVSSWLEYIAAESVDIDGKKFLPTKILDRSENKGMVASGCVNGGSQLNVRTCAGYIL